MVTEDDVRGGCLAMPGVTERSSWDQPAWFARTLMARIWETGVLTVKTHEREALRAADPQTFFWTPHHDGSPRLVLVRMDRVDADELGELLDDSYRIAGVPRAGGGGSPGPPNRRPVTRSVPMSVAHPRFGA